MDNNRKVIFIQKCYFVMSNDWIMQKHVSKNINTLRKKTVYVKGFDYTYN